MNRNDVPLGFGFALVQNPEAMKYFSALSEEKQSEILQRARSVSSRDEMQSLVASLSAEND